LGLGRRRVGHGLSVYVREIAREAVISRKRV
jgi:hypothetical protein